MTDPLPVGSIELRGVTRSYRLLIEKNLTLKETLLRGGRVKANVVAALHDVDLDVTPGTALGIVGANGAGKSTLLKLIARILPPDRGTISTGGRVVSLLELGAGFHPDFSGRENVMLNASIYGITRREIDRRMDEIIAFSGLERYIDAAVRTYSSGMYARLGFAVASQLDPDILLLDEILAVGDAAFQNKCISRIAEFQRAGVTIVFVSHSAAAIEMVCDRAIWLSGGAIRADGDARSVLDTYHQSLATDGSEGEMRFEHRARGNARLHAVRCSSVGMVSDRFVSGDPFELTVEYELDRTEAAVVEIGIRAVDGTLLSLIDSRERLAVDEQGPGRHRMRLALEALPLLEGRFVVEIALQGADGTEHHRVDRAVEFTVFPSSRGSGPVAFDGAWSHEALPG